MNDALRDRVLAVAGRLLREDGPQGLTNRRIASLADTTTMAIYSRFGGKAGVLQALYEEGVDVLSAAQRAVPPGPDEARTLCRAFRAAALAHPGHYTLLFGSVPGWTPSGDQRLRLLGAFGRLRAACGESDALAWALFVGCHGHVSLELAGYVVPGADPGERFEDLLDRIIGPGTV